MRPDRAVVISHRIVAGFGGGNRADSPARERLRTEQSLGDAHRACRACDASEQTMPRVRCAYPAGPFLSVQCDDVRGQVVAPKSRLEILPQRLGLFGEFRRSVCAAKCRGQRRSGSMRGKDIGLNLAESDRAFGRGAIGVEYGIIRIFPALMEQASRRLAMVFHEAIAVAIAKSIDPGERRVDMRP